MIIPHSWLYCLHDLVLPSLLFEPASDCRKKTKVEVVQKRKSRQNLVYSILKTTFHN